MPLSQDDFERIDKALTAVIEASGDFTEFQVDFAYGNANRLEKYGRNTFMSVKQWEVIEGIEKKMEEDDDH